MSEILKNIQSEFLDFLEKEENVDANFKNLIQLFEDTKIRELQHEFRLFLHMLASVSNNYHRNPNFFSKIDRILRYFKDDIKKYENYRIFNFFKSNKRILLSLIEEKILTVDEYFVKQIIQRKYIRKDYPQYFAPEIKPFINEKWFPKSYLVKKIEKELPDYFYEMRNKGENENYLCKLIREDLVEDFIKYVNQNCISRNATISPSIYETNSFLIKNQKKSEEIKLINYAAFFGSIQILTFLKNEGVNIDQSLWPYAIHGKNAEIIHFLEDNHIKPPVNKSYEGILNESICCHHNDIANYLLDNFIPNKILNNIIIQSLKYYNFSFIQNECIDKSLFSHLCNYDYYLLAYFYLTNRDVNIKIHNHIFK